MFLGSITEFPQDVLEQGLSQEVLFSTTKQIQAGNFNASCLWRLSGTPTIGFYRKLHTYLKHQPQLTKVIIGRLYCVIDGNFEEKGSRPDNFYRFVDNIVSSERQSADQNYDIQHSHCKEYKFNDKEMFSTN